jgi:hypothetical protein
LPELTGAFFPCNQKTLLELENVADNITKKILDAMFSKKWEIHSFKKFFWNDSDQSAVGM